MELKQVLRNAPLEILSPILKVSQLQEAKLKFMRHIWANYDSGSLKKCLRWGAALMKLALSDKSQMAALLKI